MYTSAAALALAKRKHTCDMSSNAGSPLPARSPARSDVVMDGGAVVGVVPNAAPSPKLTSAEQLRSGKLKHGVSIERERNVAAYYDPVGNSSEELRELKHKHMCHISHESAPEPELATEAPKPGERFVSAKALYKEKRHHRVPIGVPEGPEAPQLPEGPGPAGSQQKLEKLKKNHDHTLTVSEHFSPRREDVSTVVDHLEKEKGPRSCIVLNKEKKLHHKDMTKPVVSSGPKKMVSNEEYTHDKRKHRHLVDSGMTAAATPAVKGPQKESDEGKCVSQKRMDRNKTLHSHTMDVHRKVESSPTPADVAAAAAATVDGSQARLRSHSALTEQKRMHKHTLDAEQQGRSPAPVSADKAAPTSHALLARDKRGHRHLMDSTPRRDIFTRNTVPVLEKETPAAAPAPAAAKETA